MERESKLPKTLPIKTMAEAVEDAKSLINEERSGKINGLYTRWNGVNRAKFKYWRFKNVTMIAGGSGSGKSAILNMLEDDFTNPEMNGKWQDKICILAFKFEMDAADEVLRNLSGKTKLSYSYLLSSQGDAKKSQEAGKDVYNTITDEEFYKLNIELDKLKSRPIRYIENSGNLDQIWNTCAAFKQQFPDKKLIVTMDHLLLSEKLDEKDDLELTSNTAKLAIRLRKGLGAAVIILAQLNGEIEKIIRRDNPDFQFPVKTDIHCGSQIYWACDDVVIFHRPELLNITKYGKNPAALNTRHLVHGAWIKSRKSSPGNIWFHERFKEGNMDQIDPKTILWKATDTEFK
jgi:replicative DNA helicase